MVMDAELRDCRPLHDALWAVVDGEDDAFNDLELKKIDDTDGEEEPRRCEPLTPAQRRGSTCLCDWGVEATGAACDFSCGTALPTVGRR